jgi:uncharacterized membrane protein YfcA
MELRKKINYKLFIICSAISTVLTSLVLKNTSEHIGHVAFYICVILSFYFLLRAVSSLITIGSKSEKVNMTSMFRLMFFHLIILLIGLGIGVHFMGNKIIIGLINYIIQIFILGLSMKKSLND